MLEARGGLRAAAGEAGSAACSGLNRLPAGVLASRSMASEQTIHLERYAADAKALVAGAQALADERKHAQVEPLHLLARAIDRDRGVAEVFKKAGADPADVAVEAESALKRLGKTTGGLAYLSNAMLELLRAGRERGRRQSGGGRAPPQRAGAGDPQARSRRAPVVRARPGLSAPSHGGDEERSRVAEGGERRRRAGRSLEVHRRSRSRGRGAGRS